MRIGGLVAAAFVIVTSRPAGACVPAFTRAIVGAPVFEPADAVSIASESVEVACDGHYTCGITSTFSIAVTQPARATVTGTATSLLRLRTDRSPLEAAGGEPTRASIDLVPGDTALVLHARTTLPGYIDGCFTDGVIARHPYFAPAPAATARVLQIDTVARPHVRVPASWAFQVDARAATSRDPATTRIWFDVPQRRFTHGGPIVMIGSRTGEGRAFRVRGGWEAAIGTPWLVFAFVGETDFADDWNVALTAEPTTRAWVLPLTLGAGAGVVVANGTRVGARGQLSIALGAVRAMVSADLIAPRDRARSHFTIAGLAGASF